MSKNQPTRAELMAQLAEYQKAEQPAQEVDLDYDPFVEYFSQTPIAKTLEELWDVLKTKNSQYNGDYTNCFETFEYAAELSGSTVDVLLAGLIAIKQSRINSLLDSRESLRDVFYDSLMDMAGYCVIRAARQKKVVEEYPFEND